MPTQAIADLQGPLQVDPPARLVAVDPGAIERGSDHVDPEPPPADVLDGETGTVHRDALAQCQIVVGSFDGELDPPAGRVGAYHSTNRGHDAGKHQVRSRTISVSSPNSRRSTTFQRDASAIGGERSPRMAGMPRSPSQSGA